MIAPPAPRAAAGVGLVIPPRIDPSTATIRTSGGKTTRISSFWRTDSHTGTHHTAMATKGKPSAPHDARRCFRSDQQQYPPSSARTTPMPPIINGRQIRRGRHTARCVRIRLSKINKIAMPVPIGRSVLQLASIAAANASGSAFRLAQHRQRFDRHLLRHAASHAS